MFIAFQLWPVQLNEQVSFSGENCYVRMHIMRGCVLFLIDQIDNSILLSFFCLKIVFYHQNVFCTT